MNPFERGVFLENDREMKVALSVAATIGETEDLSCSWCGSCHHGCWPNYCNSSCS
ncbi:hypothetical protein SLEP1_g31060 [Rubroshorea leprosula]|uniref:Uncharacterized protein n=1 Tax=Rubroshorea leprosula TaxID=152421 RepID=A0AAV5KAA8_9ROSI|nr:hypothetical protein SLEP1_g31060 [Rubroshorea leprosula]